MLCGDADHVFAVLCCVALLVNQYEKRWTGDVDLCAVYTESAGFSMRLFISIENWLRFTLLRLVVLDMGYMGSDYIG